MTKKQSDKKDISQSVKKSYESIGAYYKHVNSIANKKITKITFFLDKQLQSEKTFKELLRLCNKFRKSFDDCNDFQTIARIKSHVTYRIKHNNFFYKQSVNDKEVETIQLIAVNHKELKELSTAN